MNNENARPAAALLLLSGFVLAAVDVEASYAIYVGKNLTADGSVLIGGSGDEVSSHWLEVVPAREHERGATVTVGVDASANMPGRFIEIPQVPRTHRYLTMNYSEYEGFPPPLTNGGLNEHNVAARDVWSPSRDELIAMTPDPQTGPNYSDLSRLAMERAHSAREAVEILGKLIDEYGYSTYGGNSHMFADPDEGWVFINYAGGRGLWIAERLGPDDVRMSYPGYIHEVPLDYRQRADFMGSANFVDFAVAQGWFDPDAGVPFRASEVYGNNPPRYPRDEIERELRDSAPLDLRRMLDVVRDVRISKDSTGYGQVASLRHGVRPELRTLWVAPTASVTAPFIPYRIGVQHIRPEYGKHRYLTKGEATRFVTRDWQIREATEFAGRTFKRLLYFTCDRPDTFYPEVRAALTAFENAMIAEHAEVSETAELLYAAGREDMALKYLTEYSGEMADDALELGNALLASIEARTRVLFGLREPQSGVVSELRYDGVTCAAATE